MSDPISKLTRQTLMRAAERPLLEKTATKAVTDAAGKAASKATSDVAQKAAAEAAEKVFEQVAAKPALAPEVAQRLAKLMDTNAAVVLPSDPTRLIGLAKAGRLTPEAGLSLSVGNVSKKVSEEGGFAAVVLSDQGKKALASVQDAAGVDAALAKLSQVNFSNAGLRFGAETALPTTLDMGRSVKHVLVDAKDHANLLKQYGEAVARGEAPAAIGGKPFLDFFRASDDLFNDLEVEAFQRSVPGFAQRALDEQRAVAALAGRVAADLPADLPATTRRRVAASMVSYIPVEGAATGNHAISELKAFYKGVPAAKGPSISDQIAKEGLRVGDAGRYGKGVYHTPSPTTAGGYTYRNTVTRAEIVSGDVMLGRTVETPMAAAAFDQAADVDTRWIRRANLDKADLGDYAVTKDPTRFRIKAITRFNPDQAAGLETLIPDLLAAHKQAPTWTANLLDRIEPARRTRAFEYALQQGTPEVRVSAGLLLARSGDAKGIQVATDALARATDSKSQAAAGEALRGALTSLGDTRLAESGGILKALASSPYLKGKESTIGRELETTLGEKGVKLLQENGWHRVTGPTTYWAR